jgi:hypothetical protein
MPLAALLAVVAALAPHGQDPAPEPDQRCRIFGAFVDELGAPVAGVTLAVSGSRASLDRARRFGSPKGWQDPAPVTTGEDGRFSLSFVPPGAFQFSLVARAPGFGRVDWRWSELAPGQEHHLGTVTLGPEAVLTGHILDSEGNLLVDGWAVFVGQNWIAGSGFDAVRSVIDPATGQFRIVGLPPGTLLVDASSGAERIAPIAVTTKRGEETFVELRYTGPDPRRRLVVALTAQPPFDAFPPDPGTVHAIASDGTRHALMPVSGRARDWHVTDLDQGSYRVEVRDPRFVEWTQDAVRTGAFVTAHLVGSAAVRVLVVDGETGAPVEAYDLHVGYRNVSFSPSTFLVRGRAASVPADGVYAGLVPGDVTIAVDVEGWPMARVDVETLAAGETRDVTVTLARGFDLRGRVVDTQGQPLAGVAVQLTSGQYPGHNFEGRRSGSTSGTIDGKQVVIPSRFRDDATTTADDGTFSFSVFGPGTYALLAERWPWNDVWTTVELPRFDPVVLTLPDAALASVRLVLPEGESREELYLRLGLAPGARRDLVRSSRTMGGVVELWASGADGVCSARHLALGTQTLEVVRASANGTVIDYEPILRCEVDVIGPGPVQILLDLREVFPVPVKLRTPIPSPAPLNHWSLDVRLSPTSAQRATVPRRSSPFGPEGGVETRSLVPGAYHVEVIGPGIRWSRPEPVNVVRGAANDFELAVPLITRELRVLDLDGAPLANTSVAYWTDPERRAVDTTDSNGALVVVLLEGTLSLALLPVQVPPRAHQQSTRSLGAAPRVDPALLNGVVARATAPFGPGDVPLTLRMHPD